MTKPADSEQDSSRDIKYISMDSENDYSIQDDSNFKNQIVYILNKIFQRIQGIYHWIIKMIIVSKLTLVLNTRLLMLKLSIIIQVIWLYYSKVNLMQTMYTNHSDRKKRVSLQEECMLKFHSSNISTKVSSVGLNSETRPQIEGRIVVLTRTDENNVKSCKITISKCSILNAFL